MRKEADFNIDDRIVIAATFSKELEDEINTNKEFFMNEVLCVDIVDNLENCNYNSTFGYDDKNFEISIKKKERG